MFDPRCFVPTPLRRARSYTRLPYIPSNPGLVFALCVLRKQTNQYQSLNSAVHTDDEQPPPPPPPRSPPLIPPLSTAIGRRPPRAQLALLCIEENRLCTYLGTSAHIGYRCTYSLFLPLHHSSFANP